MIMDDAIKGFMEKFHSRSKNDAYLGTTPKRFRITKHDEATVFEMLKISYEGEVKKRRKILISDECTISNLKKAAKWLTGDHKFSLLLYGGVGNGKSTLSRAICVLFDILSDNKWDSKTASRTTALEIAKVAIDDKIEFDRIKNADMLIIDDLGTEPSTIKSFGNEVSPITEVLYNRYDKLLPTIVTSNLNDKEINDRYGVRIADRFEEMFDKIYFSGNSYR